MAMKTSPLPGTELDPQKAAEYEQRWLDRAKKNVEWWRRYVLGQGRAREQLHKVPLST